MNDLAYPNSSARPVDASRYPSHARAAMRLLSRLRHGRLDLRLPDGHYMSFGNNDAEPRADLRLASWKPVGAALTRGDIGFAESYLDGDWSTSDLPQLLNCLIRNRNEFEQAIYGTTLGRLVYRLRHWLNRNTKTQARRNIHAHYDLGNDFYRLWLDPTLTYSSAIFARQASPDTPADDDELAAGQRAKYQRVLQELALPANARVLELGCGWGGFGETAGRAGHRVTGITLSAAQLEHARARLAAGGIGAELRLQDYRDVDGQYDGVASIEMFEAVGEKYWPSFFATLKRCLAPGRRACVQTIVIDDGLFARYRSGTDFIQQYVFPGGMLPSPSTFEAHAKRAGLAIVGEYRFGADYARTLASWRARFQAQLGEVRALGFDERFIRTWDFYLAYCEAAFACGNTDVIQYTLAHR
jgi:cyclopropane-fatty-acyl-phospholipid synthase